MENKRNLWVIPTDKPSRLRVNSKGKLILSNIAIGSKGETQNIYITSDEEIKEGDLKNGEYYLYFNRVRQFKEIDNLNRAWKDYKKIILTTDQDLIKDGVQSIDDEFLEWFVKNPNCEKVEVYKDKRLEIEQDFHFYEIIIPKEEQDYTALLQLVGTTQRLEKYSERFDNKDNEIVEGIFNPDTWGKRMVDDVPKQETLEEFAERMAIKENRSSLFELAKKYIVLGAKWKQQNSYSEEEVEYLLYSFKNYLGFGEEVNEKIWFEQFKKK